MKTLKWLVACLGLLTCIHGYSQTLAIESFNLAQTDLTANTPGSMEYDQNGNLCALIKVESTLNGFTFNVGSLGVTTVRRVGGEIWVYVPFSVKRITISHPQLGVLRDYPFPCPIERGRTYIMKLTSGSVRTIIEHAPTKQFLHITLNPADAILEINGKIKATQNGVYQELLPFGEYKYKAYCHDYHEKSGTIKISDPEQTHKLKIDLTAAFGTVSVSSRLQPDIEGAAIYIDDKYVGQIPASNIRINSGTHRLRVIKELYEAYHETFTLNDGESLQLTPNMKGDFATVTLLTDNSADIYVNGEFKAKGSWTGKLAYGSYVFESRQDGHIPFKWSYDVTSSDRNNTIRIQSPTPIYGSLAISSTPSSAKIRINGKYVGETPKFVAKQVIGEYTIECELDGYRTQTKKVKVSENTESTVSFIMAIKPAEPQYGAPDQSLAKVNIDAEEEAIPFQLVEEKPSFMGGDANQFSKWVNQRLVYPEIAKENGVMGRVTLQFTIGSDGAIRNIRVLRGVDPALDKEAIRVVSMSPKWTPGKQRGRAVPVTYTFPVIFQFN